MTKKHRYQTIHCTVTISNYIPLLSHPIPSNPISSHLSQFKS